MNQKVAEGIYGTVGNVVQHPEMEVDGGSFIRVRINLYVTRPLS